MATNLISAVKSDPFMALAELRKLMYIVTRVYQPSEKREEFKRLIMDQLFHLDIQGNDV